MQMQNPPAHPIRVFVIEAQPLFRSGVLGALSTEADVLVVGESSDSIAALKVAPALAPDAIVLGAPVESSQDIVVQVQALRSLVPRARVVVLGDPYGLADQLHARSAGPDVILNRAASRDEVCWALLADWRTFGRLAPTTAPLPDRTGDGLAIGADLTDRERELLRLMARGLRNKEIGLNLDIAMPTVKFHIGNIMSKLHAANRTTAVVAALRHKLVCLE